MAGTKDKIRGLPETRVWASTFVDYPFSSPSTSLTSTLPWASDYRCDRTASGELDQRFYSSQFGRFLSADRFQRAAKINDSGSWNKYSYTRGDPVNRRDRRGTCDTDLTSLDFDSGSGGDTGCDDNSGGGEGGICASLGLVDAGNGQCVEPGGALTSPSSAIPCTSNSANIFQTYADIGSNILEIAESGIKDLTGQEISGLQTLILGTAAQEGSSLDYYNGGHFNLDLSASELRKDLSKSDFRDFKKLFGGHIDGTRQDAVWGNAAQGNYTLHSKEIGRGASAAFDFHFDIDNPYFSPAGLVGHLFGDVIGGHNGTPCLDPAWNQQ